VASLLPAYATFGVGTKGGTQRNVLLQSAGSETKSEPFDRRGPRSPAAYDHASDFESTGFNSNCTGRIRSLGADGRQRAIKSHVSGPEISGARCATI
jgi:hypothetical protein